MFRGDQVNELGKALLVVWAAIKTHKDAGMGGISTYGIGAAGNDLEHAFGRHETGVGNDVIACNAFEDKDRRGVAKQNGMDIASHAQRMTLGLALDGGAVNGQQ